MFGVSVLCVCWSVALAVQFACRIRCVSWVFDSEELPLVGDAFARVGAAISERDARAADKVGDSARDEDFVRPRERLDSLGDVDGDAADVVTAQLDFASVETATHTDADGVERVANGAGAAHRSPRPIEGRQDAIARVRISRPQKRSSSPRVRPWWVNRLVLGRTVHNWLVAAGVSRRPSPATVRQDISDDEIVGLYVDGGAEALPELRSHPSISRPPERNTTSRPLTARRGMLPATRSARVLGHVSGSRTVDTSA
jgi:hypothetical protein